MSDPYRTVPAGDGGPAPGTPPGGSGGTGRRRAWFIVLGIVAALLIIAVTIAITLLATRGGEPAPGTSTSASPSPTASPSTTPSVSPTATPTATPTPTAATPSPTQAPSQPQASIASFTGPSTAGCLAQSAPAFRPTSTITFSWSASGVNRVAFGVATNDAIAQPYQSDLPPSGSIQVDYPCTNAQQSYTLTVAGPDGVHVSKTLQVRSGAN